MKSLDFQIIKKIQWKFVLIDEWKDCVRIFEHAHVDYNSSFKIMRS